MSPMRQKYEMIVDAFRLSRRFAGNGVSFANLFLILVFAYADRDKNPMRRFLFTLLSPFLAACRRSTITLSIRFPGGTKPVTFSTRGPTEFWSIRSVIVEVLDEMFYDVDQLNTADWIIDAGANVGLATLFLADKFPGAQFFCYEPSPETCEILKINLERNRVSAQAFPVALADQVSTARFSRSGSSMEHHLIDSSAPHSHASSIEVDISTLDAEVSRLNIPKIDLLKIDVEGAESRLLKGAKECLGEVGCIVAESHGDDESEQMKEILLGHHFEIPPETVAHRLIAYRPFQNE